MITLYELPPAYGMAVSVSPYCAKVEAYLRLAGHSYEKAKGNVLKSPTKTVPYVRWEDGDLMADSDQIIAHLESVGPALNEGMTEAEAAHGAEMQEVAQKAIYYACLHHRFVDEATWPLQKETVRALVPWILSPILTRVIRNAQAKKCAQAGFARNTDYAVGLAAVDALSQGLGDKPFFTGDQPRTFDCGVWGPLANAASTPTPNPVRDTIHADDKLHAFVLRMSERTGLDLPLS